MVVFDKKPQSGRGEYTPIANWLDAASIRFKPGGAYRNAPAMLLNLPSVSQDARSEKSVRESYADFSDIVETGEVPEKYLPIQTKSAVIV